ncbi:hypothetical protein [Tumebacillus flagellatus]|uniref:Uncharacterized protein n=1 Tax=Tumebacillus flagellatus TaxID=1157490 RepID=A0A074LP11_9BACL|nr:hypothetical protein [Tumebacillus flagellatus]KEO82844.1 hypothetical protein EL26_13115 [Tumebacillus flagellatus]
MSDPRWNHLPEELKSLGKKSPDTPSDPAAFKERVLREYERRTRWHLRARWMRRGVVLAGVCTAALLGVLVAKPALSPQEAPPLQSAKSVAKHAPLTKQEVVERYFNFILQKRPSLADANLAQNLRGKLPVFGQNRTNPHLTGYRLKALAGDQYEVTLNWATYGAEARLEVLQVSMAQESGNWVISGMKQTQQRVFASRDQATVRAELSLGSGKTEAAGAGVLPSKNGWSFFAADPTDANRAAFAQQGDRPLVYVWQTDRSAPKLTATMPEGEIGEMLWGEDGLLVVNFSPKTNLKAQEIWFVDTAKGDVYMDEWLVAQLKERNISDAHAVHMLAGNRLELRSGTRAFLADLTKHEWSEENVPPLQMEESVFEGQASNLPTQELSFFSAESAQEWLGKINLPPGLQIDPARDVGFYVLNGSVESLTLDSGSLQVEVSKNPGHLQVLRVPLEKLKQSGLSGKQMTISVYDESGTPILGQTQVRVP